MVAGERRGRRSQVLLVAAALLGGPSACVRRSAEVPRPANAPVVSQGLRVYRDPSTGAFGEPPPGTPMAAPAARPAAPSAMSEEAAPGGGRMIRLRGAFHSHMVGHLDESGRAAISCETTAGSPAAPASVAR